MNPMRKNSTRILTGLALVAVLAGCGVNREAALRLAEKGTQAATTYQTSMSSTITRLDTYVDGQVLQAPLRDTAPPTAATLDSFARIERQLQLRAVMMADLADAYVAMSALSTYDAAGEVESSITDLNGSINEFGLALGSPSNVIGDASGQIAARGGGFLAGQVQARMIRKTSELLRGSLEEMAKLLERERGVLVALNEEIVRGNGQTVIALWNLGIGRPDPILREQMTGSVGLQYEPGQYDKAYAALDPARRARLRDAVADVVRRRTWRALRVQDQILGQTITGVRALIVAHEELEAGEEVTLASVAGNLAVMRSLVDELSGRAQQSSQS